MHRARGGTLRLVLQPQGETPEEETIDLIHRLRDIPEADYKKGLTMLFLKKNAARLLDRRMTKIRKGCEGSLHTLCFSEHLSS